ncbi:hypothetical protein QDX21_03570 [Auritidibacter ignavus]|uniref:Uncharacterized protein n=1 Tax=Auritidibacter ignavus TaxID=678932 RepID=A0AAJ6AI49_9MICC|nr:hypothetical protein [Auritidibacter ignavus]WGH93891.1 hypothetical protein QDX21_03570 [Auritidibacter ignavus]
MLIQEPYELETIDILTTSEEKGNGYATFTVTQTGDTSWELTINTGTSWETAEATATITITDEPDKYAVFDAVMSGINHPVDPVMPGTTPGAGWYQWQGWQWEETDTPGTYATKAMTKRARKERWHD